MPEPEEKNPADELLKVPFSEVSKSVILNQAISSTILQLQIRIISNLEGRDLEDVKKEVTEIFEVEAKKTIDNLPKTL
jgi:hypothetical protein